MKQIFFVLALIVFVSAEAVVGPAKNVITTQYDSCDYDGFGSQDFGVSGCVDRNLYSIRTNTFGNFGRYYDKCCYIRYMKDGEMYGGCFGLYRDQYIDITETMRRIENGEIKHQNTSIDLTNSKIYELDCKASYLSLAFALALLSFLF